MQLRQTLSSPLLPLSLSQSHTQPVHRQREGEEWLLMQLTKHSFRGDHPQVMRWRTVDEGNAILVLRWKVTVAQGIRLEGSVAEGAHRVHPRLGDRVHEGPVDPRGHHVDLSSRTRKRSVRLRYSS